MALTKQEALRAIPPVNEIMNEESIAALAEDHGRDKVLESVRKAVEAYRAAISDDEMFCVRNDIGSAADAEKHIAASAKNLLKARLNRSLKRVVNATGVTLHTNLGRAPLPRRAAELMSEVSAGYSNLEFDLETGMRGSRQAHIEALICKATGAESALVVNNNAAAVFLCLNTLAMDRGVVISRGQQVEIGGSFRIPDIIVRSGAKMIEIGTTNKTRPADYREAVTDDVSILLKVHTSNYKITGFVESVPLNELVRLAFETKRNGAEPLIVMEDLGSGSLLDLTEEGIPYEPTVQECIRQGADLVTFSGDKLLGGPQAGIIAGRKHLIDRIRRNPLMRMVRCDKTVIAALTAVFDIYASMDKHGIINAIPALRMLAMSGSDLTIKAQAMKALLDQKLKGRCGIEIIDEPDEAGGGTLPGMPISGKSIALTPYGRSAEDVRRQLREACVPIVARISRDRVLLGVRTIEEQDYSIIAGALADIFEADGIAPGKREER